MTGVFIPDNPQEYGAPEGKIRHIVYPICETCFSAGPDAVRIEKIIKAQMTGTAERRLS
jgi:hypothetical protein